MFRRLHGEPQVGEGVTYSATQRQIAERPASLAIAEAAERLPADLVVMGTRQLTGLEHVAMGSFGVANERSLDLDLESVGRGAETYRVARIAVVDTHGLTRDGSGPTITADCRTMEVLEREVGRLRRELDDSLTRAARELEAGAESARDKPRETAAQADEASARERPQLEVAFTVREVMTRDVRTVRRNDSLSQAKQMLDSGGFRHLVVLGDDDSVVGVISQRDIFFGPLAWSLGQGRHAYEQSLDQNVVKDVMQGDVVSIDSAASLHAAARLMGERKIGCLPVVDGDALVGIVTEGDFLALFA